MTTIHTGNTTTTGFVVTADNSGDLVLKTGGSGGTAAATFDGTTQQATFNAPVSQPGAFMFRNKLINGNFDIWQRGTSQTSNGYGSADRWFIESVGSTKTASRQNFALGQTDVPDNPSYFMRNVVTSIAGAGNYAVMYQRIEGVQTFSGKSVTLSFWAKADAAKNIAVEFVQHFGSGGTPSAEVTGISTQLINLTTSWEKYTVTVTQPSVSGKTLGTDGNSWMSAIFWFDAGSNNDARAASLGQQSGTFDIAQVQIEEGTASTPFEMRPIGMELSLCERYYQNLGSFYPGHINTGNTTALRFVVPFSVLMRASPTVTFSSVTSGFSVSNVGGIGQAKRLNIEVTASARTDFRPRIDAIANAEL